MPSNETELSILIGQATGVLVMLADLGGFAACLIQRKLSPRLLVMAAGFAGLFVAGAIYQLFSLVEDLRFIGFILSRAINVASNFLLVFGLGSALNQIRRQVALSLEPRHARG